MNLATAAFALCTLSWGTIGVLVRDVDLPSPAITWFRLGFGLVVVLGWLAATGRMRALRPDGRPWLLIAAGAVLGSHWVLQFEAYDRLPVAAAILIVFLGPVLTVAFAPLVLRERVRAGSVTALAVALAGIALMTVPRIESIDAVGVFAALGSAALFAVLILIGKILTRTYEAPVIVAWQFGVALVLLAPGLVGVRGRDLAGGLPELVLLGAVLTGGLGVVFFHAIRVLEAQRISVLFYLEPASAVMYAWWLLGERPSGTTLIGAALIVLAGIAIIGGEGPGRTAAEPAPARPEEFR